MDPLGVGAFNPGNGGGIALNTPPPVIGMTMGPPALSIPHATADPGTSSTITSFSAVTVVSTSSTTPKSESESSTTSNMSMSTSATKLTNPIGIQEEGRTMPVFTDVRTTGTPRVDSYGAAAAINPVEISNHAKRGLKREGKARLHLIGIGTGLIILLGILA